MSYKKSHHGLLDGLNEHQKEAVLHNDSPLLILAGAGSGKTRVITVKIAWLISELAMDAQSILAVTFTNKAAEEMRQRTVSLEPQAANVMIRTFHSFGAWLLRRNAALAGLSPSFCIYDDDDSVALLQTLFPQQTRQILSSYARMISRAKDYGLSPDDDLTPVMDKPDLAEVYQRYQTRLNEIGNCDFGDLILRPLTVLRNDSVLRNRMHDRFKVILVDEYQDSNVAQYELLKVLAGPGCVICVVGDDDQSIYRFRGAEVRNILDFPERFANTHIVRLEQNYRSTDQILKIADALVSNNTSRLGKTMWTSRLSSKQPELLLFPDSDTEVEQLVKRIAGQELEGTAILYRTNAQSRSFETALLHAGIAYRIIGTLRFYEREEVKDALALLRLLANPHDELALRRVINKPSRGIGAASLEKILEQRSYEAGDVLKGAVRALPLLSKKAAKGLEMFLSTMSQARAMFYAQSTGLDDFLPGIEPSRSFQSLGEAIYFVMEKSGLKGHYEEEDRIAGSQKLQNLGELANAAGLFSADLDGLVAFLEAVELDSARENDTGDDKPKVTLITMHNTKGLEFDRVYITGLEHGLFPREADDEDELEEERRLFYVALTRARDELVLTSCATRRVYGRTMDLRPSQFLAEIPEGLLEIKRVGIGSQRFAYGPSQGLGPMPLWPKGTAVYHDDYGSGHVSKSWFANNQELVQVQFESGRSAQFVPKYSSLERLSR